MDLKLIYQTCFIQTTLLIRIPFRDNQIQDKRIFVIQCYTMSEQGNFLGSVPADVRLLSKESESSSADSGSSKCSLQVVLELPSLCRTGERQTALFCCLNKIAQCCRNGACSLQLHVAMVIKCLDPSRVGIRLKDSLRTAGSRREREILAETQWAGGGRRQAEWHCSIHVVDCKGECSSHNYRTGS